MKMLSACVSSILSFEPAVRFSGHLK